ncbi:MAG TPA: phosphatase PAP2 family protein [Bryobacteraceae bacterium]|nr:phosphatase PAP2 family protein [Bryobacteraceae bacterium]
MLPIAQAFPFLPWGVLNKSYTKDLPTPPGGDPPLDWDPTVPTRVADFWSWMDRVTDFIADNIWPRYDGVNRQWLGAAANAATMQSRTTADLAVLGHMRANGFLGRQPAVDANVLGRPTHATWFREEDGPNAFVAKHAYYDATVSPQQIFDMATAYLNSHIRKEPGFVSTNFKLRLQRPRPYQMANVLPGVVNFSHLHAASADSPSACSGHALQGLCAVGGVIETMRATGGFSNQSITCMLQYGLDIGDRRVMAGVHYPTDNLISWIIFLSLADHIYRDPGVKGLVKKAMVEQSVVYQEMKKNSELSSLLALLDARV